MIRPDIQYLIWRAEQQSACVGSCVCGGTRWKVYSVDLSVCARQKLFYVFYVTFLLNMVLARLRMLFRWRKNCVYYPISHPANVINVLKSSLKHLWKFQYRMSWDGIGAIDIGIDRYYIKKYKHRIGLMIFLFREISLILIDCYLLLLLLPAEQMFYLSKNRREKIITLHFPWRY